MKTISLQIGNTDDKLSQKEWYNFCLAIKNAVKNAPVEVHFLGAPSNWSPWQNFAVIFTGEVEVLAALKRQVKKIRELYRQDSVAWTSGITYFI